MAYKVVIGSKNGKFPISGWNEVIDGKIYNPRTKKYHNPVKAENDRLCRLAIQKYIRGIKFDKQIQCTYNIYTKDKMHDRQNLYSVDKSFYDALQQTKKIPNDGWKESDDSIFHTMVDKLNPRVEVIIEEVEI